MKAVLFWSSASIRQISTWLFLAQFFTAAVKSREHGTHAKISESYFKIALQKKSKVFKNVLNSIMMYLIFTVFKKFQIHMERLYTAKQWKQSPSSLERLQKDFQNRILAQMRKRSSCTNMKSAKYNKELAILLQDESYCVSCEKESFSNVFIWALSARWTSLSSFSFYKWTTLINQYPTIHLSWHWRSLF